LHIISTQHIYCLLGGRGGGNNISFPNLQGNKILETKNYLQYVHNIWCILLRMPSMINSKIWIVLSLQTKFKSDTRQDETLPLLYLTVLT
jgi:hypothetical protein